MNSNDAPKESPTWPKVAISASATSTLMVALFGFGSTTALTETFGLTTLMQAESLFDLLTLSWYAFTQFFEKLPNTTELFKTLFKGSGLLYVGIVLIIFIMFLGRVFLFKKISPLKKIKNKFPNLNATDKSIFKFSGLLLIIPIGATTTIIFSLYILMLIFGTPLFLGYSLARAHAIEYIIKPEACQTLVNREKFLSTSETKQSESKKYAMCIQIKSTDKEKPFLAHGRLVISTSKYAILYHPKTGKSERYTLENTIISPSETDENITN